MSKVGMAHDMNQVSKRGELCAGGTGPSPIQSLQITDSVIRGPGFPAFAVAPPLPPGIASSREQPVASTVRPFGRVVNPGEG